MNGNAVVANSTLEAIADAIREKTGTTGQIKPHEMPALIMGIRVASPEPETDAQSGSSANGDAPVA